MRPEDVQKILNAYGAVLAEPTALGVPRDIRSLPYRKIEIKHALVVALSVTTDPGVRDHLKTAYISLGDFQQLSDREVGALHLWNNALSKNVSAADPELTDAAKIMSAESAVVTAVQGRVVDEAKSLLLELKAAGF